MYNISVTGRFLNVESYVNVCWPLKERSTTVAPIDYKRQHHGCYSHAGDLYFCGDEERIMFTFCEKLIIKDNK